MQIIWKLFGARLGGIFRSMKKSSMILPVQACTTLWRTKLDWWPPLVAQQIPWTNSSILPHPGKLHMSEPTIHNSSRNSSSTRAAEIAFGLFFQRRQTKQPVIHPRGSWRHQQWHLRAIRIKQTRHIRIRRTIVMLTARTMTLNRYLQRATCYGQLLMMQISEHGGELLPSVLPRR